MVEDSVLHDDYVGWGSVVAELADEIGGSMEEQFNTLMSISMKVRDCNIGECNGRMLMELAFEVEHVASVVVTEMTERALKLGAR